MAQSSRRLKAARRVKRQNTLLHRQTAQLRTDMEPIIRRAQIEGQILRALLNAKLHNGTGYMFSEQELSAQGEIDITRDAETNDFIVRYIPTPLEQSKVTGSGTTETKEPPISYAEPEAAV